MVHDCLGQQVVETSVVAALGGRIVDLKQSFSFSPADRLVLDRRRGGGDGVDDMELLALFARQATLAVETSRIFSNLGQALLESAALATQREDLRAALEERAVQAPRAQVELAELALLFHDLGQLGPDERRAAARIAEDFLVYARKQRR